MDVCCLDTCYLPQCRRLKEVRLEFPDVATGAILLMFPPNGYVEVNGAEPRQSYRVRLWLSSPLDLLGPCMHARVLMS
jgi:hypothetical protein